MSHRLQDKMAHEVRPETALHHNRLKFTTEKFIQSFHLVLLAQTMESSSKHLSLIKVRESKTDIPESLWERRGLVVT